MYICIIYFGLGGDGALRPASFPLRLRKAETLPKPDKQPRLATKKFGFQVFSGFLPSLGVRERVNRFR